MAITRVNSASISGSGTTSAVATIPGGTGILAGDLIVVSANCNGTHAANGMSVLDSVNATNYTTIKEQDLSAASSRWLQTFFFVTPVNIADGSTITLTAYAASAAAALAVDVFRGVTGTISNAATGTSPAAGTTSLGPALGAAPAAGNLVLSFNSFAANTATLTVAGPFTAGSKKLAGTPSAAIGYVLSADGSSTYAVTWTNDSSQSNADVAVAFTAAASAAAVPAPRMRPAAWRRSPSRAALGARGLCAAGILAAGIAAQPGPSRLPQPVPVIRHAVPHRAAAGGIAARGPLLQDFELGPAGAPVTTANSGGGNDVAFTVVSRPAGAALTFDNADAAHGTQCAHFTTDVTGETCYLQWSAVPGTTGYGQAWFRFYLKFAALPAANVRLMTMLQGGALCGYVQLLTTGKLQWVGQNGVAIVTTATSVPSGQWVRAEGYLTGAAATGTAELKLFLSMDSATADETQTSGATAHTTGAPDTYRFGVGAAVASIDYRLDDIGISTVGYLGPSAAAAPPAAVPPPLWHPQPRTPAPHAALWRARAVAPGQPQGPPRLPLPLRRPGPHRAIAGGVRGPQPSAAAPGVAVPPPGWHPQSRSVPAHRVTWRAAAGLPAPPQTVTTPPPRQPPQVPRRAPARALWRSRAVPPRLPGLPVPHPAAIPRQAPHRVIWRLVTGQPPTAGIAVRAPKLIPQPRHLPAARGTWRRLAGPGNAPPPPFSVGSLTASGAPSAVLTAAGASSTLTAATAPSGTLTAGTQSTGGPQ